MRPAVGVDQNDQQSNSDRKRTIPLTLLQLGDSYSSGNGAGSYAGIRRCGRSMNNWGHWVASKLGKRNGDGEIFAVEYADRACSGATVDDITDPRILVRTFNCLSDSSESTHQASTE